MSRPAGSAGALGLPGLDPSWSRVVDAPDARRPGRTAGWHLLDTGASLAELGLEPVGTILAVHGNPTWSYLWRGLAAATVAQAAAGGPAWRVVAVDQLEMGFSARTGVERTLADRVRDLGALTAVLGLSGRVVTIGHDWGGVVSLGWAVDHPDLLAGVLLTNTAVHQRGEERIPAVLRLALAPAVTTAATETSGAFLETTLAIAHPPLAHDVREAFRAPYRTAGDRAGIGGFVRDIPVDASHASAAELDRIADGVARLRVPALIMWGPRDPVFQERYLDDLRARLPHAGVHRFEGAGHLLPEDADVAGTVLEWLAATVEPGEAPRGAVPAVRETFRPLWAALDERRADSGTALVEAGSAGGGRRVSWRLLARRVREIAAGLHREGVVAGDRVALLVPPGADLTAVLYACLRIGAVVVVADAGLGLAGLTRAVRGARPDWVVGVPSALAAARALRWPGARIAVTDLPAPAAAALGVRTTVPALARSGAGHALPEAPAPDDLAAVLFTSGSTGPAKGVRYTHRALAGVCAALAAQYGIGRDSGLVAGFAPFALLGPALGCRTSVPAMDVTRPGTLTATALAAAVAAVDADAVFLSPAALRSVVATAGDGATRFARVGVLLSAGAPVGRRLLERAAEVFPAAGIHTPYGMTECLLVADVDLAAIRVADSAGVPVGTPVEGVEVRLAPLDADGRATGTPTETAMVTGEVLIRAPHMLAGYDRLWRTDHAARMPGALHWHRTGDVGRFDADGVLHIEGRLPHVVSTADGPVTPVAAEQRIETLGPVRRAAIVGVGPVGTQQVVAVVETGGRAALAPASLAAEVRAVAGVPVAAVLSVPAVPTDIRHNSKIDRSGLAGWAAGVLAGGRMTAP